MNAQDTNEKVVSPKKTARRKKGRTYLIIAAACFVVYYIMYTLDLGGAIGAFLALATLICFVGGVIYLIGGFVGQE